MDECMWKVGDRVVSVVDHPDDNEYIVSGMAGYVCILRKESETITEGHVGVCWDEYVDGHSCRGSCESGHGWIVREEEIEPEPTDEPYEFDEAEFNKFMFGIGGG